MNQDVHPKYQPPGTYRFGLTGIMETDESNNSSVSNELGNAQESTGYPTGKFINGHRLLDDGTILLALFDPTIPRPNHELGFFDPVKKTYTTYLFGPEFGFSDDYYINIIYKLKNGCERVAYLTDNYNPYRVVNLDHPEYYTNGVTKELVSNKRIDYSRPYINPDIKAIVQNFGGSLPVSTRSYALCYLDQDFNATDYVITTNFISIVDESEDVKNTAHTVNQYDGGVSNPGEVGYVAHTNKSVKLTISNLDTSYSYYQIAVIKYEASSGAITGVDILNPEPIGDHTLSTTTQTFIDTGYDSQIENQTTLDKILSERQKLYKVVTHDQKDGRLFVAGLTDRKRSYTGFQRWASSIKAEFVQDPFEITDPMSKDFVYYFDEGSMPFDEIEAFGVVPVFTDGSFGPVLHVPGRSPINNSTSGFGTNEYLSADTNWDTKAVSGGDVNIYNTSKQKRWQVYNTYTTYDTTHLSGLMGYYETTTTYPIINDCEDIENYWGTDWLGNDIVGGTTKIRHHRMPPHTIHSSDTNYNKRLGVKFTVTNDYPSGDIIGHFFVRGDHTFEKTIVDRGFLAPLIPARSNEAYAYIYPRKASHIPQDPSGMGFVDVPYYAYISPNTLFKDTLPEGNYITVERYYHDPVIDFADDGTPAQDSITVAPYSQLVDVHSTQLQHKKWSNPISLNYKLDYEQFLGKSPADGIPISVSLPPGNSAVAIINDSVSCSVGILKLNRLVDEISAYVSPHSFFYNGNGIAISIKSDTEVFRNLDAIEYIRMNNSILTKELEVTGQYESYDGAAFLGQLNVVDFSWSLSGGHPLVVGDLVSLVLQGDFNFPLRHGDYNPEGKYTYYKFPNEVSPPNSSFPSQALHLHLAYKYYKPTSSTFSFYSEAYLYNNCFTQRAGLSRYLPLLSTYDFCSSCTDEFPYRIRYSNPDDIERRTDGYLTMLVENYQDIDGMSGPITDMFTNFNELYVNTIYTLLQVPTNPQVLDTSDGSTVFIGNGKVFQTPPRKIQNVDNPYGGVQYWKSRVITEYGTAWVDAVSRRPLLLGNDLNDLSLKGMRVFWQENAEVFFASDFKNLTGTEWNHTDLSSPLGVGYITSYDPKHKRLIFHKKDYRILPQHRKNFILSDGTATLDTLWFYEFGGANNRGAFYYNDRDGYVSEVTFDSSQVFENKSFTISFDLKNDAWAFFHPYLPYYMFNDAKDLYSNDLYRHGTRPYQTFYGIKYPHILDIIATSNPGEIKTTTSIQYAADVKAYSITDNEYTVQDETFTEFIAYNSRQSTGLQTLINKNVSFIVDNDNSSTLVNNLQGKWRLNDLRDLILDNSLPIWSKDWANISSNPYSFIDKVPNNIDYNKSLFYTQRLRDYYLGARFFYNSSSDNKITTDLIQTYQSNLS